MNQNLQRLKRKLKIQNLHRLQKNQRNQNFHTLQLNWMNLNFKILKMKQRNKVPAATWTSRPPQTLKVTLTQI